MPANKPLTDAEAAKKWREQQEKSRKYWQRYSCEIELLREKCAKANIIVTPAEVEARWKEKYGNK